MKDFLDQFMDGFVEVTPQEPYEITLPNGKTAKLVPQKPLSPEEIAEQHRQAEEWGRSIRENPPKPVVPK